MGKNMTDLNKVDGNCLDRIPPGKKPKPSPLVPSGNEYAPTPVREKREPTLEGHKEK